LIFRFQFQLNVSPLQLVVYRQIDASYTQSFAAKESAYSIVYAMSTMVPVK
jgi:hypothetical protein